MEAGVCVINLTLGLIHRLQYIFKFLSCLVEMSLFTPKISIINLFNVYLNLIYKLEYIF